VRWGAGINKQEEREQVIHLLETGLFLQLKSKAGKPQVYRMLPSRSLHRRRGVQQMKKYEKESAAVFSSPECCRAMRLDV